MAKLAGYIGEKPVTQNTPCHKIDKNAPPICRKVLVALGGNVPSAIGSPEETLRHAIVRLGDSRLSVLAVSRFFATPCFPAGAGPDYVNAAAVLTGSLSPDEILQDLHRIEAEFGRVRDRRWGQRTLDIDLVAIGDTICPDRATWQACRDLPMDRQIAVGPDRPILPHPRLQDRAFVLIPLNDVAPDWVHPVGGLTMARMLDALPQAEKTAVTPL